MGDSYTIVCCPRCGSTGAKSVEEIGVELDRMRCDLCAHEEICDTHQIQFDWNELVPSTYVLRACMLPAGRFHVMWRALGATRHGRDTLTRLRAAYDEPSRAYHTSLHIAACLALLDDSAVSALATHPAEVEAALWFHDAVYDTHARDNEERSAALARDVLTEAGVARDVAERIAEHVLATRDHAPRSPDGALVIDVDLSILGAEPATYARFEDEVRREYAWVDDDAFAEGRVAVLRRFVERPFIYSTALFRERLESTARANLAAAIDGLARPR